MGPAGDGSGEFNPGFTFELGPSNEPARPVWELSGAIKAAKQEQTASQLKATTIDQKIQGRLTAGATRKAHQVQLKQQRQGHPGRGRPPPKGATGADGSDEEDDETEDEDDGDDDDDDDKPLPGELGDDDDDDGDLGEDEDADEEEEDEEDGEEDNQLGGSSDESVSEDDATAKAEPQAGRGLPRTAAQPVLNGPSAQKQAGVAPSSKPAQEPARHGKKDKAQAAEAQAAPAATTRGATAGNDGGERNERGSTDQGAQGLASTSGKGAAGGSGDGGFFARAPDGTAFHATSFGDLQLSRPLTRACHVLGYTTPTPIQAAVIPLALAGRDICGSAVTGSGKTAAFALPCLERLLHRNRQVAATYVVVLTPTRELAVQVHAMITQLAQFTDISAALVVGGLSLQVQSTVLRRSPEVVVATPGRLIDHLRNTQSVGLEDLAVLILDEADRLLDMGFEEEIREIVRMAPRKRQTMLFSATFNEEVKRLVALSLKQPVRLAADAAAAVPKDLKQEVLRLKGASAADKEACLLALCARTYRGGHAIIFFRTKQRAHRAKILFGLLGLPPAAELHGDMTQAARLESLEAFRSGAAAFLLATDVAARGLDIQGVQVVLNYDAPHKLETHLHRIGRTARAGAAGVAVTFVEDGDRALLKEVVKRTKVQFAQRVVPPGAVAAWQGRIEAAAPDVARIVAEEREERELRRAEMEAAKMQNMMDHEDEIKARPPRTWFQSERQKRESATRAAREAAGQDEEDLGPGDARTKAAAKQDAKNKRREKRKLEAAAAGQEPRKRKDALAEETGDFTRQIKSAKGKLRALRQQGLSAAKATRIVGAQAAGVKSSSGNKKRKQDGGGKALFSGDGTGRAQDGTGSAAGTADTAGGSGAKYLRDRSGLTKTQLNRVKRGGVGKKAFKSRAKYKRR